MTIFRDRFTGRTFDVDARRSRILEGAITMRRPPQVADRLEVDIEATWQQARDTAGSEPT